MNEEGKEVFSAWNARLPSERICNQNCLFWSKYSCSCDYILHCEKRRPCKPGKDCTVFSTRMDAEMAGNKIDSDVALDMLMISMKQSVLQLK